MAHRRVDRVDVGGVLRTTALITARERRLHARLALRGTYASRLRLAGRTDDHVGLLVRQEMARCLDDPEASRRQLSSDGLRQAGGRQEDIMASRQDLDRHILERAELLGSKGRGSKRRPHVPADQGHPVHKVRLW